MKPSGLATPDERHELVGIYKYKEYTKILKGGVLGMATRAVFPLGRGRTMSVESPSDYTNCTTSGRYWSSKKTRERNRGLLTVCDSQSRFSTGGEKTKSAKCSPDWTKHTLSGWN